MYNLILKYILDRLRPTQSKKSSSSLNFFNNSPCFLTIFMIFLFAPFKRFHIFLLNIYHRSASLHFLLLCSFTNHLLLHKLLVLMQEVLFWSFGVFFFLFVFLGTMRNYKLKKILLKPFCRFTKRCQTNFVFQNMADFVYLINRWFHLSH